MSGLGAFFTSLAQSGQQYVDHKSREKERLLQAALERERLDIQRQAQAQSARQHEESTRLQREGWGREDARATDNRGLQQAQFIAQNYGGQEDIAPEAAALMDKYLPGSTTRKNVLTPVKKIADTMTLPGIGEVPTPAYDMGGMRESVNLRETMPSSTRNALIKAQTDSAKLELTRNYQAQRIALDQLRVQVMQQRATSDAAKVQAALDALDLRRQELDQAFDLGLARIEASIYGTEMRAQDPENPMDAYLAGLMNRGAGGAASGLPSPTPRPTGPPPVRPTLPTRRTPTTGGGGGGTPSMSIDDIINGLGAFVAGKRQGGG